MFFFAKRSFLKAKFSINKLSCLECKQLEAEQALVRKLGYFTRRASFVFVVEALLSDYSEVYYDFLPCYDTYTYLVDIFQTFVELNHGNKRSEGK